MSEHHTQLLLGLQEAAADFINAETNKTSLITVTRAELSEHEDRVTFYVSVFPETAEQIALGFLLRKRGECRDFLKTHLSLGRLPHVEFSIDEGEKKRRRVDELLQE